MDAENSAKKIRIFLKLLKTCLMFLNVTYIKNLSKMILLFKIS